MTDLLAGYDSPEVVEETRAFNARLEALLAGVPPTHTQVPAEVRAARREGRGPMGAPVYLPEGRNETIPGRRRPIPVRVFTPPVVAGVYLYIHGGGWVLGSADQQDPALWNLAQQASVAVVSVDYRLAPEDPYPAGPDDCEDAARWLVEHSPARFGTDRLVIGGGSAGAHLAVVTLLRLMGDPATAGAFRAANLAYGVFDLTMTPSQRLWGDRQLILSTPTMAWFYDCFLPGMSEDDRRQPDVSPIYAALHGLPPARFVVGTLDPLLDDTLFMEARWRVAGARTQLEVVPDAVHGFTAHPTTAARLAQQSEAAFVGAAVAAAPSTRTTPST